MKNITTKPGQCGVCSITLPIPRPAHQRYCSSCALERKTRQTKEWALRRDEATIHRDKETQREFSRKLRRTVLEHYGSVCACCGESHHEFLVIDHIDGCGTKKRKEHGGGNSFYGWLKAHNYPEGFQVLCDNCNSSLGRYGYCPHHPEITRQVL